MQEKFTSSARIYLLRFAPKSPPSPRLKHLPQPNITRLSTIENSPAPPLLWRSDCCISHGSSPLAPIQRLVFSRIASLRRRRVPGVKPTVRQFETRNCLAFPARVLPPPALSSLDQLFRPIHAGWRTRRAQSGMGCGGNRKFQARGCRYKLRAHHRRRSRALHLRDLCDLESLASSLANPLPAPQPLPPGTGREAINPSRLPPFPRSRPLLTR